MEASRHALGQSKAWGWVQFVPVLPRVSNRSNCVPEIVEKLPFKARWQVIGAKHCSVDQCQEFDHALSCGTRRF